MSSSSLSIILFIRVNIAVYIAPCMNLSCLLDIAVILFICVSFYSWISVHHLSPLCIHFLCRILHFMYLESVYICSYLSSHTFLSIICLIALSPFILRTIHPFIHLIHPCVHPAIHYSTYLSVAVQTQGAAGVSADPKGPRIHSAGGPGQNVVSTS